MKQPELLLPAGSPEAFHAAIAGGADAVYLGLSRFNARGRAKNFNLRQLAGLLKIAEERDVRVYITLNTLIKNSELGELLDTLHLVSNSGAAAVIIQDWGIYYLIRKYFPGLEMHASTQLGIHNSIGAEWLKELGFTRAVLARELTLTEIASIEKCGIEVEVFVHGALCYSLSGHCLFSSWLGGMSANRGLCRQPCRRLYSGKCSERYLFSLNDLQLIEKIPELSRIGVDSLKIEGRMKNAEYVHTVARAYRMVLDDSGSLERAKVFLERDLGRMKSGYFAAGSVKSSLSNAPFTGLLLGRIRRVQPDGFTITPTHGLTARSRLRIMPQDGRDTQQLKVKALQSNNRSIAVAPADSEVTVIIGRHSGNPGDYVYLTLSGEDKFPSKIPSGTFDFSLSMRETRKKEILGNIRSRIGKKGIRQALFLRIDSLKWMPKIFFNRFDFLLLKLTLGEMQDLDLSRPFLKKNINSLIPQLPLFIPQNRLSEWRAVCKKLADGGITRFALAQPGQQSLLPDAQMLTLLSTEDAYILNDAAALAVSDQGFSDAVLPLENDLANLEDTANRGGIVPLYGFPPLFRSRMPLDEMEKTIRDRDAAYNIVVRDGITTVTPQQPAAILQHRAKLEKLGYRRFLIDFSFQKPSQNAFNRILGAFDAGKPEKQARLFNFKDGLQ